MQIIFTEKAAQQVAGFLSLTKGGVLKLTSDSEGCGCSVSGVPALWLTDGPTSNDFRLECDSFELWMDKKHEVFFEDRMTIDLQPNGLSYVLKSTGQIYNAGMKLLDKRTQVTG